MPKKLSPQFIARYDSLPKEIREVLFSANTSDIITQICDFYHLSDEKSGILTSLVGDVLMGFLHYNDFSKKLAEALAGNTMVAQSIAKDIDRDIFLPLRKFLREIYRPIPKEELMASGAEEKKEVTEEIPTFVPEIKPVVVPAKPPETKKEAKISPAPTEAAPSEAPKRRSFLPFFRFKKTGEASPSPATPPVIIGHEQEIKPTLETPTPFVISFEEVKPQKEKVVSSIEVAKEGSTAPAQPKMEAKKIEPAVSAAAQAKPAPTPVKIVNYTAFPTEPAKTKEPAAAVSAPAPAKTPAAPILEQKKEEPPVFKIPPTQPQQPPIVPQAKPFNATPAQAETRSAEQQTKPAAPIEKPTAPSSLKTQEVPPENVVDLRKFKF